MGPAINTRRNEGSPSFSPDGLEIISMAGVLAAHAGLRGCIEAPGKL